MKPKIAYLGVGIMGSGMIRNLQKKGFKLKIYNRTEEKAREVAKDGDQVFSTPVEAAENADIIIASVSDDKASKEIWFGENGVIKKSKPSAIAIETSTLSIPYIDEWIYEIRKKGLKPVDCPVTGSKKGAEEATLSLFVGCDKKTLSELSDVFDAISRQTFYFGKNGNGMRFKLIYNMLGSIILTGLAEALGLAQTFGLDVKSVVKVLSDNKQGWSQAAAESKGMSMAKRHHSEVSCTLKTLTKDIKYAIDSAHYFKKTLPTSEAALKVMNTSCKQGGASLDMSVVGDLFIE